MPATGEGRTFDRGNTSHCQQLEKEEHLTGAIHLAVSNWRVRIARVCVGALRTSDWADLSVFLIFLSAPNVPGCVWGFGSTFQAGLGSDWEEKLYLKPETEVGKGAQGLDMAMRQADITKHL